MVENSGDPPRQEAVKLRTTTIFIMKSCGELSGSWQGQDAEKAVGSEKMQRPEVRGALL